MLKNQINDLLAQMSMEEQLSAEAFLNAQPLNFWDEFYAEFDTDVWQSGSGYTTRIEVEEASNAYLYAFGEPTISELYIEEMEYSDLSSSSDIDQLEIRYAYQSNIWLNGTVEEIDEVWLDLSYLYVDELEDDAFLGGYQSTFVIGETEGYVDGYGPNVYYLGDGDANFFGDGDAPQIVYGQDDDDYIDAGAGADTLSGGDGDDDIDGNAGDDLIYGDAGMDWLFGDEGDDAISGGAGKDNLFGGEGNDVMNGNAGDDRLYGDDGADRMIDGEGNDYYSVGWDEDSDTLIFNVVPGAAPQTDTVGWDFNPEQDQALVYDHQGNVADAYLDALVSGGTATYGGHEITFVGLSDASDSDYFLKG